jgi:hypothetical protein
MKPLSDMEQESRGNREYDYLIGQPICDAPKTMTRAFPVINNKFIVVDVYYTWDKPELNWYFEEHLDVYIERGTK